MCAATYKYCKTKNKSLLIVIIYYGEMRASENKPCKHTMEDPFICLVAFFRRKTKNCTAFCISEEIKYKFHDLQSRRGS